MTGVALLLVMLPVALTLAGALLALRWSDQHRRDNRRRVLRLHFPLELGTEGVVAFVRSLAALRSAGGPLVGRSSVVFEVVAARDGIEHRLRLPAERADLVLGQLKAAIPALGVEYLEDEEEASFTAAHQWRLMGSRRSLRSDQPESASAALLAALGPLGTGEAVTRQLVVVAAQGSSSVPGTQAVPADSLAPLARQLLGLTSRPASEVSLKELRDKAAEPPFETVLRIGARARTPQAAEALVSRAAAVLRVVERPGVHFIRRWLPSRLVVWQLGRAATPVTEFGCRLNARELAVLVAWPLGSARVEGLRLGASRRLEPAGDVATHGRVLGVSSVPGLRRSVALSAADSLHHSHVLGPTGVGKSTLLANLIAQDIESDRAVVVIDPKGDLVRDVVDRVPQGRRGDVILLDPTDEGRPVGLNLLHGAVAAPELVTDAVVAIFHRLYAAYWGPRTSDMVTSALLTLARAPGMTLCELPLVFTDDGFRRRLTGTLDDPVLAGFWAWFEALSPGERATALGPVMNKLRAFLLRRRLRNVIGQAEPTWSLSDVLNRRQVLLVNLARGQLGSESANLVGSLVVALLWQAIQVRTVRLPAMVVLDEFQDVLNLPTDLGEVLAQARGFGVGLTLAHQHLGQLSPSMRQAVLANARTKVAFQLASDDAGLMAKQIGGGLTTGDLTGLPTREAYVAACVGGAVRPPASIRTLPLPPSLGSAQAVRQASRERYGRDRAEVEAAIASRGQAAERPDNGHLGRRRRAS